MGGRRTACRESAQSSNYAGKDVAYLPSECAHNVYVVAKILPLYRGRKVFISWYSRIT